MSDGRCVGIGRIGGTGSFTRFDDGSADGKDEVIFFCAYSGLVGAVDGVGGVEGAFAVVGIVD